MQPARVAPSRERSSTERGSSGLRSASTPPSSETMRSWIPKRSSPSRPSWATPTRDSVTSAPTGASPTVDTSTGPASSRWLETSARRRDAIGEYVATVAAAGGPSWPMATEPRAGYVRRGKARMDSAASRARLRIRLRAAFGVNARADILAALLAASPRDLTPPISPETTRFTKPNVASALDALILAGLVTARPVGNERRVGLPPKVPILPGLRPPVAQPDWVSRFGVALEVLRFTDRGSMSNDRSCDRSAPTRRTPRRADVGRGHADAGSRRKRGRVRTAFDRWVVYLVDLRAPAASRQEAPSRG